jgi:hypothetical protein
MISDYLEVLADALGFDHSLSRRVRQEVEDHLREAVAADPMRDRVEAERRAVANFGDPHSIARQFVVLSLARQTRRAGVVMIVVVAGIFATMKARVAWYAFMQWSISDEMRTLGGIVGSVDRYSFWLSVLAGIGALVYIGSRHMPQGLSPGYRRQLRRFFLLCIVATGSLAVSVICDGVLTTLQLLGKDLSAGSLLPFFLMAIEIAGAGVLMFQVHRVSRRATATAALLKV